MVFVLYVKAAAIRVLVSSQFPTVKKYDCTFLLLLLLETMMQKFRYISKPVVSHLEVLSTFLF